MMKWMLAAGAAALAISVPVTAQGGGRDQGRGQAAQADRGGKGQAARESRGGARAQTARPARAERQGGGESRRSAATQQRGQADRGQARNRREAPAVRNDRGRAERIARDRQADVRENRARADRVETRQGRIDNRAERILDRDRGSGRIAVVDRDRPAVIRVRDVDRGVVRVRNVNSDDLFVRRLGYGAGGCPPGLARKPVACLPPGQAAKWVGQPLIAASRVAALDPLPRSFRSLYWDDDDYYYRYGGGYLYRVDRDDELIAAMIPLFGAALIGQPLRPAYYSNSYYTPPYFNSFYPNSPYDCYRYGYGYVYETDCMTGLVEDVIPTYDYGYGIGQILPASYSYYNLPYTYRSHFVDDDDYYYRYAPGAIYRVDRDTALISAVAALLTGGLGVGQPLPVGYSAYNVPLAYRSTYYDRPDIWYRYDNGYIYGVDPRTRVVSNVAYVIV